MKHDTAVPACSPVNLPTEVVGLLDGVARILIDRGLLPLASGSDLRIGAIWIEGGRCVADLSLPMPYGERRMTIRTGTNARVTLPGLTLSPMMERATLGRPIGRLIGHPAFDDLDFIRVTAIEQVEEADGAATVLYFDDLPTHTGSGTVKVGASMVQ